MAAGDLGLIVLERLLEEHNCIFIFTDATSSQLIETTRKLNIPVYIGNPRDGKGVEVFNKTCSVRPDVLVSVNYRFLIDLDLINLPTLHSINIHGSLLPRYRGRAPLIWAIINGEIVSGITVHVIDEDCDTGPVIFQRVIEIPMNATGFEMVDYYGSLYPDIVVEALNEISSGKCNLSPQANNLATYYGKRSPDDGLINWSWQYQRIQNWVRALAPPYPGAFSYLNGIKIIVDKVVATKHGYRYDQTNGTVIAVDDGYPIVKVQNSSLKIYSPYFENKISVKVGDQFLDS
jgi:methionyl-tRNA formyltransferase